MCLTNIIYNKRKAVGPTIQMQKNEYGLQRSNVTCSVDSINVRSAECMDVEQSGAKPAGF